MKKTYTTPVMKMEGFVLNTAVAKCKVDGGISYVFDCMKGPNTDTESVIAQADFVEGTCSKNMGYAASSNTARSYGTTNHSNNAGGSWSSGSDSSSSSGRGNRGGNSYIQVTYSGLSGVEGLLYGTESGLVSGITVESGIVTFSKSVSGTHRQVAPVIDSYNVKASW